MPVLYPARLFDIKTQCFVLDPRSNHGPSLPSHSLHQRQLDYRKLKYAILSHRWDEDEMSYEQLMKRSRNYLITNRKFEKFCEEALLTYGCRYVWMDSGCINQEDTQEVEDAIRSMYWYYRQAEVCIVYLADAFDRITFSKSSWFTRGWTLQELLAPSRLAFYYGDWKRVSPLRFDIERQDSDTHAQRAKAPVVNWLEASVMKAAGVSKALLCQHYTPSPDQYTTVRNWSKTRDTSRDEDIAYSLVSLLNVCLPCNYGEGLESALWRLCDACDKADNSPPPPLGLDSLRVSLPPQVSTPQARKPTTSICFRDNSAICKNHRDASGNPTLLHVIQTHPDRTHRTFTFVLFTSIPIPKDNLPGFFHSVETDMPFWAWDLRMEHKVVYVDEKNEGSEIIPSILLKCRACSKRFKSMTSLFYQKVSHFRPYKPEQIPESLVNFTVHASIPLEMFWDQTQSK